jgi:hypothetical protein
MANHQGVDTTGNLHHRGNLGGETHPMRQRFKAWLCDKLGHRWRWATIADATAQRECDRCGLRLKPEPAANPPQPDWWTARKRSQSKPGKP